MKVATLTALDCETHLFPVFGKVRTAPIAPPVVCVSFSHGKIGELYTVAEPNYRAALESEYFYFESGGLVRKKGRDIKCDCGHPPRSMGGDRDKLSEHLRGLLDDSSQLLVGHNLGYDFACLAEEFPELRQALKEKCTRFEVIDTQTLHALLFPDYTGQRSLKKLAAEHLRYTLEKDRVRTSFRRGTVLSLEQRYYAVKDALITEALAQNFIEQITTKGYGSLSYEPEGWRLHPVRCELNESRVEPFLLYSAAAVLKNFGVEARGLRVDPDALLKLHREAEGLVEDKMRKLVGYGLARAGRQPKSVAVEVLDPGPDYHRSAWTWNGRDHVFRQRAGRYECAPAKLTLNIRALTEVYEAYAKERGLEPPRTGRGAVSLEYDYWKQYKDEMWEGLRTHLDMVKQRKLLSTYFRPLTEALDKGATRVFPSYGVGLTETGRWSCFKPNIQNQPKSIRHLYLPTEGRLLVGADYKSLELYTLCHCMGKMGIKGPLYDALASEDVHSTTASLILDKRVEEVTKGERDGAKACNFGVPGGLGPRAFAKQARQTYGLDWSIDDAREMKEAWLASFPDVAEYMQRFRIHPLDLRHYSQTRRQFLESLGFDPRLWPSIWDIQERMNQGKLYKCTLPSGRIVPNRRYSQAMNLFFQGTGADVITLAYVKAEEAGLEVVAVVHDSITIESREEPRELIEGEKAELECVMVEAQQEVCTHAPAPTVEAEIRDRWF